MPTAADMLRMIAKEQLKEYVNSALTILKTEPSPDLRRWVNKEGLAKIELALIEAYMEVLMKRREEIRVEILRFRKKRF